MSFEELKSECVKRELSFNETDDENALRALLFKDDLKPPCWGKIYSRILYHTGINYEEIAKRTIPQIMAILHEANENISIKIGMPSAFDGALDSSTTSTIDTGKPPKLSEFMAFANAFND